MHRWSSCFVLALACGQPPPPPPGSLFDANFMRPDRALPDSGPVVVTPDSGPLGTCVPDYFELAPEEAAGVGRTDVYGGTEFIVSWTRDEGAFVARVEREGEEMMRSLVSAEGAVVDSSAIADGLVVWSEEIDDEYQVVGRPIRGMDPEGPEERIGRSSDTQILPAVDRVGDDHFVAWIELGPTTSELHGRFWGEAPSATRVLGLSVEIEAPAVVGRDDHAIVAWRSGDVLHVARVNRDGLMDGSTELETNHAATGSIDLSFNDEGGIVVFESDVADSEQLYALRLDEDGAPRGAELRISAPDELEARFAHVGTFLGGYVVGYRGTPMGSPEPLVRLAFIHGSTGDRVHTLDLGAGAGSDVQVAVAEDGTVLATWTSVGATGSQVVGSRVLCGDVWLRCSPR